MRITHLWSYTAVIDAVLPEEKAPSCLSSLASDLGMKVVGVPSFYRYRGPAFNYLVHCEQSHIIASTYPEWNRTVVEADTCTDVELKRAREAFDRFAESIGGKVVFFAPVYVPLTED